VTAVTVPAAPAGVESPWLGARPGRRPRPGPAHYTALPWVADGACRGRGDLFFGPPGERSELRTAREAGARLVCSVCPVLEPCRRWAREQREYGFWGGESEEERVAAGFPVLMPIGRVAKTIQAMRTAARELNRAVRSAPEGVA